MKRIALIATLAALLVVAPAWAQSEKAAAPEKATAPLKLPAKAEAGAKSDVANLPTTDIKPVYRKLTKRSYLDARECLEKKTEEEIIICAEKFL